MFTYQRLISAVVAFFSLALILYLDRSPSTNNTKEVVVQKEVDGHDDFPVLAPYVQSDEEYSDAMQNRSAIIQEYELENEPPLWNHTDTLLKVFPPAFRCPHEVSHLGKVAVCGPVEHLAKRDSCVVYSLAPSEDLHSLQDALAATVGYGKCDVYGYDLARNGLFYVALPSITGNNTGPETPMHVMHASLHFDNTTGRLSGVGKAKENTEEHYVSPWTRIHRKEHTFIDILRLNLPSKATHRALVEGWFLRMWRGGGDGSPASLRIAPNAMRVGHIILKLRLDQVRDDGKPMHPFGELRNMWESLEFVGLRPFAASIDDDGYLEYSFVNIHVPRDPSPLGI